MPWNQITNLVQRKHFSLFVCVFLFGFKWKNKTCSYQIQEMPRFKTVIWKKILKNPNSWK